MTASDNKNMPAKQMPQNGAEQSENKTENQTNGVDNHNSCLKVSYELKRSAHYNASVKISLTDFSHLKMAKKNFGNFSPNSSNYSAVFFFVNVCVAWP